MSFAGERMAAREIQRHFAAAGALLTALGIGLPASAEQFVVAEATYTHSAQTTKDSHYYVEPSAETPANWASPVDYANGSVHVRLEVKTKPSDAPTRYQICFEMEQNYCCTAQAPAYTGTGVYEWDTAVEDLWRPGPVDFTQGIVRNALILKDTMNVKPAPENVGEETSQLYLPTDLSVTVTVVSAGAEFMPPEEPMPMGGSGGSGGSGGTGGGDAGGQGGSAAGTPVLGGAGGLNGGMPPVTPEPTAGSAPSVPVAPAAGSGGAPAAAPPPGSATEDASCGFAQRAPSASLAWLGALVALVALRRRRCAS